MLAWIYRPRYSAAMPAPCDISSIHDVFRIWKTTRSPEGLAELARDLGVEYQAVAKWAQRGRIPPESWEAVRAAARRKGRRLSASLLSRLNKPRATANQIEVSG
jgi:hypothetical protein